MKLDSSAFQLFQGLDEISGIGPQAGVISSNHHVTGLTGKPGQPLDLLPPWSRIFTAVRVRAGNYYRIPTIVGHHIPESLDPFCKDVSHNLIS
jgi:hypothetical protein